MNRRTFVAGLGAASLPWDANAEPGQQELELNDTHLRLWHRESRLHVQFSAPTKGWLAVGFNNAPRLKDTRFVIGAVRRNGFHAEEHIALVPDHRTVQSLGLKAALHDVAGDAAANRTRMTFSLPHVFPDTGNPALGPGTATYLMLAWSHHQDFDHHSAWRRHLEVTL